MEKSSLAIYQGYDTQVTYLETTEVFEKHKEIQEINRKEMGQENWKY